MRKRLTHALTASVLMSSLVITPVLATPTVDELEANKSAAQSEVSSLQEELNTLITKMNDLEEKLIETGEEIIQTEEDLKTAEEKERQQYADMKLRIQYMYEEGDASAFERLVTSGTISEMLNQIEYVEQVHSYDRDMLTEYENTVKEVEQVKTTLEEEKKKMETVKGDYETQKKEVSDTISAKRGEIENLDELLQEAARAAIEEEETQGNGGNPGGNDAPPQYNVVTGNAIVDRAYACIGKPYVYATAGPDTFDCSGLVGYCIWGGRNGTTVEFMAMQQVSDPQPGDICTSWSHCGIYIGGGQMIHAPTEGETVCIAGVQGDMIYVRP